MIRDPNSFEADIYTCKRELSKKNFELKEKQAVIDDLIEQNKKLGEEFQKVLNSKGWRALEKARKIIPRVKRGSNADSDTTALPEYKKEPICYNSHYEDNIDFSKLGYKPDVKALAFYLPQFHTFRENDKWWGKGFTEWTNTKKAKPCFEGHYQPKEPNDDIGYYVLDNINTIKKQVKLAKEHGIYGFCFYYYWFSGKRLMEKPLDLFLEDKTIKFPFCLCWANENWTRRWDGKDKEILIKQEYKKNDPRKFILDIKKYLMDPRYIKVDDKPVVLVYDPDSIPDFEAVVKEWKEVARKEKIGEILVWSKNKTYDREFKNADFVDAEFDFTPTGDGYVLMNFAKIDVDGKHQIFDYGKYVDALLDTVYHEHTPVKPFYYSCTMGWDNSPRRKEGYLLFSNYSPEKFYSWTRALVDETERRFPEDRRFIFVNAWNEWAEGTYLEPDKKYGYTNINTLSRAIYGLPYDDNDTVVLDKKSSIKTTYDGRVAIQVHAYYLDVFGELVDYLSKIPFRFDLYISTDSKAKKEEIEVILGKKKINCGKLEIGVIKNVGRDVYPFLKQLARNYQNYDIIGHFHTKKTKTEYLGDTWREHIYKNLLGSSDNIRRIFAVFDNSEVGLMMPTDYSAICHSLSLGNNFDKANCLLKEMNLPIQKDANKSIRFPVGTMFWARSDAIAKIFELGLQEKDFPEEAGQVDGTVAHALERLFGIVPVECGYKILEVINKDSE